MVIEKIGFGGGCHWCTEAYFQSLKGVEKVEQGWIGSATPNDTLSEAVIVHYDPTIIPLRILIAIHLHTHASTKSHSFRAKYCSAVYVFGEELEEVQKLISECQSDFEEQLITQALLFKEFKLNPDNYHNYYKKNKKGIFCERYISPKLRIIENGYTDYFERI